MILKDFRFAVGIGLLLCLNFASEARATVYEYDYTGNNFTFINTPGGVYTTSDQVTGEITFSSPLADNLSLSSVTPAAFTFSDGVQTLTSATVFSSETLRLSTNATGQITAWDIVLDANGGNNIIETQDYSGMRTDYGLVPGGQYGQFAYVNNDPGTWTEAISGVPEPSTWAMMILGFCGLGFMSYRRQRASPHVA